MKEQLKHIWYYYKWYIIAGILALVLAVNYFSQRAAQVKADFYVAVVTGDYIPEDTRDELGRQLAAIWAEGEKEPTVYVNFYQYDAQTTQSTDTSSFMASAVQLAADLRGNISCCFFTDCPELLLEIGTLSAAGNVADSRLENLAEIEDFSVLCYDDGPAARLFG